ncbi:recombinase family protein [Clostridium aquiflavi]|uniref:Recombinase family protein n=1 Tax=Clostridium aquiflavi TaxID=3073603 RepID=A0ABU1ECD8_9CLOT|nr:recombinase family protein [Clostridium sp. 5N-1]MDR5586050.1 recombinase family protein [Clostridium sp. 5N-1]
MAVSRNVMVIPARKRVGNNIADEKPKLRVAAYCRVSTDSDEQAGSYEVQIEHYTEFIKKNPEWAFAGIFADDGISGTNTKKRDEFNKMIEECMAGNIDMVITKSISRFARNTLDCLQYIRKLKEKNIAVYFEKENINSLDSKGEIMLTIMASLAQQESQSLSQNVKLGIQYRYQQGIIQINTNRFLGYTKDENKHLIIVPEEAEIIKRIYREYLEGSSMDKIKKGLERDGILTSAGKKRWHTSTIRKILSNEKYMGDALLQKTYTVDFLTKKRVKNNGVVPQYYVENSHEAIIPKEIFMQVQEELIRRSTGHISSSGKKRNFSCSQPFSQIVFCGECGEIYRRVHWNNRGKKSIVWRCVSRLENTGLACHSRTVLEDLLKDAVVKAINDLLGQKNDFLEVLSNNIETVINEQDTSAVTEIEKKLEELQKQLLIRANSKEDYNDIADEIYRLREEKHNALAEDAEKKAVGQRLMDMTVFLKEQPTLIDDCDEQLIKRLIKKISVFQEKFLVEFKSGVKVDVVM